MFFIGVCLFVSRIAQKLLNRFSQDSVEMGRVATTETIRFCW